VELLDRLVDARDVAERDLRRVDADRRLARDLPNDMTFEPPPCTWFIRKIQNAMNSRTGSR
jgi:hypothetical protein